MVETPQMEIQMANVNFSAFEGDLNNFVTLLTRSLVDVREKVFCKVLAGEDNAVVEINCDPTDYGILIGKKGSNINAMTRIVATAFRDKYRYVKLQVVGAAQHLKDKQQ